MKDNEALFRPETRGDENGEEVSLPIRLGVWGNVVRSDLPAVNYCRLIKCARIAAVDSSKFFTFSS